MRLRLPAAAVLFVGSYLPLSAILLVQDFDYAIYSPSACWPPATESTRCVVPLGHPVASLGLVVVCTACFAVTVLVLRLARAKAKVSIIIKSAKHVPSELMSYALPYVVAFMNMDYEPNKLVGLAIFLVWLFWIIYKSGQIVLNPFLAAFGWKLYELTYRFTDSETEYSGKALCDNVVVTGERYSHQPIDEVIVVRTKTQGGGSGHVG